MDMLAEGHALAVGLGEIQVSRDPQDQLVAYGLGSCVAVAMHDPAARIAGLLHAVLPERPQEAAPLCPKYVDAGIQALLEQVEALGAVRFRLHVRLVGGANMLALANAGLALNIGERNIAIARSTLAGLRLRVAAEDVGGNKGRTVRLSVADGRMTVRVLGSQTREL